MCAFSAGAADVLLTNRHEAAVQTFSSMAECRELVGGQDRCCTELIQASRGSLIRKHSVDGCHVIGARPSEQIERFGAQGAVDTAMMIEDSNINILYSAIAGILEQLRLGHRRFELPTHQSSPPGDPELYESDHWTWITSIQDPQDNRVWTAIVSSAVETRVLVRSMRSLARS